MNTPTRTMREIPQEWDKIMRLADQIENGRILVKIQDKEIHLEEYTVQNKKKMGSSLETIPLI